MPSRVKRTATEKPKAVWSATRPGKEDHTLLERRHPFMQEEGLEERKSVATRYLEDFQAGQVIKHWPGRTIRDFDNTWFTLLTMNTNPLHFDEHYAGKTQHGRCLVNGVLVFAIVVGMSVKDVSENCIANLEYESIKHLGPTFHGDTIYAESEILDIIPSRSKPDRGVVYLETRAWNQQGKPVLSLRRRVLMPRRQDLEVT